MAVRIEGPARIAIILLVIGGLFCGYVFWFQKLPQKAKAAADIGRVVLPNAPEASLSKSAVLLPLPSSQVTNNPGTKIVWKVMAWNSQFGLMYANGGAATTKGSLIDKASLTIDIVRQDDCNKSCADIVKFAKDYQADTSTPGVFISFMGDGMPAFFAALTKELNPKLLDPKSKLNGLGPDYQPVAFYSMGKSYGEDQVMGPVAWKNDPKQAIGKVVCGVLRDGDINILLKWAGDNGLKVNPDETSYDPNAINLMAANDFLDAPNKYITGYTEPRKLIVDGKKTSKDTTVGVDAVATWTPGDVNVAEKKGGLVTIASTKQYATQMPNVTFTIRKYLNDHRNDIENLIIALATAGDQVRSFNEAKAFAAKVSADVYAEQAQGHNANYWLTYYNGKTSRDVQGLQVNLGGSMVFNLADAANMYGLGKDGLDRYKMVYKTFGDILSKMYPEIMPVYPDYAKVVDKSFMLSVIANHPELMEGKALTVQYAEKISEAVSSRSYQIQFATNSSTISSSSYGVLEDILRSAVVGEGLKVGVYGHTDNIGNDESNMRLSAARAESVKNYLISKGIHNEQIESDGFGSTKPIADNSSTYGRAQNRRVEIVLGQ